MSENDPEVTSDDTSQEHKGELKSVRDLYDKKMREQGELKDGTEEKEGRE